MDDSLPGKGGAHLFVVLFNEIIDENFVREAYSKFHSCQFINCISLRFKVHPLCRFERLIELFLDFKNNVVDLRGQSIKLKFINATTKAVSFTTSLSAVVSRFLT